MVHVVRSLARSWGYGVKKVDSWDNNRSLDSGRKLESANCVPEGVVVDAFWKDQPTSPFVETFVDAPRFSSDRRESLTGRIVQLIFPMEDPRTHEISGASHS